jgi:cob(I)alamin adenosyltransferase
VKIYTRKGDDGTTGLFYGGRVAKDATGPSSFGDIDETGACLGMARAETEPGSELNEELLRLQRILFIVAAELATAPENRGKLVAGETLVTQEMVADLERAIDEITDERGTPDVFIVPGNTRLGAALDVARTTARRAERSIVTHMRTTEIGDSHVPAYINRLTDYLYMLARAAEEVWTPSKETDE